jgi:hypothetical protein
MGYLLFADDDIKKTETIRFHKDTVCMKSNVLTAVKRSMLVFWVETPCNLVSDYRRFGRTYGLHIQPHAAITKLHA